MKKLLSIVFSLMLCLSICDSPNTVNLPKTCPVSSLNLLMVSLESFSLLDGFLYSSTSPISISTAYGQYGPISLDHLYPMILG